ncbi:MAG: shikimate kinase [Gemmatimonadota bacterium]|nr:shikimate kinase [Gemmatimonadota bacterium]
MGRGLARRLARAFLDFDVEIGRREGATIPDIFQRHGEAYFRAREVQLTLELGVRGGMVLAPGGGWIMSPSASALLRPPGRIIYLKSSPARALERLGKARSQRPLLAHDNPRRELERLLREREASYLTADDVVMVDELSVRETVQAVLQLAPLE